MRLNCITQKFNVQLLTKTYQVLLVWCYRDPFMPETLSFSAFAYGMRKKTHKLNSSNTSQLCK